MTDKRNSIDLDSFLADKLRDWYADTSVSEAEQLREACKLMTAFISNRPSSEIISSKSPSDAVVQFKFALDDSAAWDKVEMELKGMSQADLDAYQFPDLVHYLTLL